MTTKPKTRTAPVAHALARHKAAQAHIDAHFGQIDDEALADRLFTAESEALKVLAETPCASDAEFVEKLRVDRDFNQVPIGQRARIGAAHDAAPSLPHLEASSALLALAAAARGATRRAKTSVAGGTATGWPNAGNRPRHSCEPDRRNSASAHVVHVWAAWRG